MKNLESQTLQHFPILNVLCNYSGVMWWACFRSIRSAWPANILIWFAHFLQARCPQNWQKFISDLPIFASQTIHRLSWLRSYSIGPCNLKTGSFSKSGCFFFPTLIWKVSVRPDRCSSTMLSLIGAEKRRLYWLRRFTFDMLLELLLWLPWSPMLMFPRSERTRDGFLTDL